MSDLPGGGFITLAAEPLEDLEQSRGIFLERAQSGVSVSLFHVSSPVASPAGALPMSREYIDT
jgi:hypothetical protein